MGIQICDLSEEPLFQNDFLIIAGYGGLRNEISYISVIDTPLIPRPDYRFDAGVFVLSSFFLYKDDPELLLQAIENLVAVGAAAIGVKTDLFVKSIPQSVMEYCDRVNIPLFEMNNKNLPFRKVISVVENIINQHEHSSSFFSSILGENIKSVFYREASECMNVNFICMSASMETIVRYSPNESPTCEQLEQRARDYLSNVTSTGAVLPPAGYAYLDSCYYFPCYVYNAMEAILVFEYPTQLSDYKIGQIRRLAALLSLEIKDNILLERGKKAAFINQSNEYLLKEYRSEAEARNQFELLGFPANAAFRLLLVCPLHIRRHDASFFSTLKWESDMRKALIERFPGCVLFTANSALVCLLPVIKGSKLVNDSAVESVLSSILYQGTKQPEVRMVYSELEQNLRKIYLVYQHVLLVLRTSPSLNRDMLFIEKVKSFDMLTVVASLSKGSEEQIYESIINPILEFDRKYHGDLWITLEECMKTEKLETAAANLHIHSSTLRYRLQKLETITGFNYFSFKDKAALYAAFLCHSSQQK